MGRVSVNVGNDSKYFIITKIIKNNTQMFRECIRKIIKFFFIADREIIVLASLNILM